ncbi:hypothetical protein RRG08_000490 [Elysia crispata]|uniref:Uncharacterized protein n=1 Tax=Elysia crispata TaxID=231223 RepID=A0AAE0YC47_9GAST|nr:hypothetical protein RRG08_000490 [Elysia crispata]
MFSGSSLRSLRAFGVLWQKFQLNELRCILSSPQTRTSSPLMIAAVNNEYFYLDNTTICHRRQSKQATEERVTSELISAEISWPRETNSNKRPNSASWLREEKMMNGRSPVVETNHLWK